MNNSKIFHRQSVFGNPISAAIADFRLRLRQISQNVLAVATATPPGILLIFLVSFKNKQFRYEKGFQTRSRKSTSGKRHRGK